jgi:23S rRNA (cytosine1962-C5)-methyltransferase
MIIPQIILKVGKEQSLKRFHPWLFSGAIKKIVGEVCNGDVVDVYSHSKEFLGKGHYQDGSIAVRILSFDQYSLDDKFWEHKIRSAYELRFRLGLAESDQTNIYRLVNAEGDGLAGLIIDYYDGVAVLQAHSLGINNRKNEIVKALKKVYGEKLKAVYDKSAESLHHFKEFKTHNSYLYGSLPINEALENGIRFYINWEEGQKTGFFVDQRENRKLLSEYVKGKVVLNTFCYSGGFSMYALKSGANKVCSVDSSKKAIEWTEKNVTLNGFNIEQHHSEVADVMQYLKKINDQYDVIILDPPAFAKHLNAKHNALQAYKRLNFEAIKQIKKGGIVFTFTCSQVITRQLFSGAVFAAAIEAKRNVRVLHQLSQPPDHPNNIFHPEGEYLKGLVLYVE